MIDTIYSVAVMVSDRKKAARWYKEKLGFDIKGIRRALDCGRSA